MKHKNTPYMPFFPGDFMASTSEWEGEEASLYLTLLMYQWAQKNLPVELSKLCRLIRWHRPLFDQHWPTVSIKFVEKNGRLVNERLEEHRAKAEAIARKNAESGKKGGKATQQKQANAQANAQANDNRALEKRLSGALEEISSAPLKQSNPIQSNLRVLAKRDTL